MALADDIRVHLGGGAIALRPSLRHAIRLERRPGGFQRLLAEVQDESLTTACDIIAPHYDSPMLIPHVFGAGLSNLTEPLVRYVLACAGIDPDAPKQEPGDSRTVPFGEYLQSLYRIGTGWLGWTPDATLDATPLEIGEAYKGRLDMLKSIFGGADDDQPKPDARTLDAKFRTVFGSFGTTVINREAA